MNGSRCSRVWRRLSGFFVPEPVLNTVDVLDRLAVALARGAHQPSQSLLRVGLHDLPVDVREPEVELRGRVALEGAAL
jgi:hypothetical protein